MLLFMARFLFRRSHDLVIPSWRAGDDREIERICVAYDYVTAGTIRYGGLTT
jgi:hypothetical protein